MSIVELKNQYPLPPGWTSPEIFSETKSIGNLNVVSVGLVSQSFSGAEAVGSAAGFNAFNRAYFELCERISIIETLNNDLVVLLVNSKNKILGQDRYSKFIPHNIPNSGWVYAKSNGIALNKKFSAAAQSARYELIERDSLLLSWYGYTKPRLDSWALYDYSIKKLKEFYNFSIHHFPSRRGGYVTGVFGYPLDSSHPLTYGFGAGRNPSTAINKAFRECIQRLSFLWGEEVPQIEPNPSSHPSYHQDYWLVPGKVDQLKDWLDGQHFMGGSFSQSKRQLKYLDLTLPHFNSLGLKVIQALPIDELQLKFGIQTEFAKKMQVHPIV